MSVIGLLSTDFRVPSVDIVRAEVLLAARGAAQWITEFVLEAQVTNQSHFVLEHLVAQLTHELVNKR